MARTASLLTPYLEERSAIARSPWLVNLRTVRPVVESAITARRRLLSG
jgi:hypothetical protein